MVYVCKCQISSSLYVGVMKHKVRCIENMYMLTMSHLNTILKDLEQSIHVDANTDKGRKLILMLSTLVLLILHQSQRLMFPVSECSESSFYVNLTFTGKFA